MLRRLGCNSELGEHALEVGVVELVEDDEAGVDGPAARRGLDLDGVGVAARVGAGLEHVDVVAGPVQLGGGDQAGHAGADDRDPLPSAAPASRARFLQRPRQRRGASRSLRRSRRPPFGPGHRAGGRPVGAEGRGGAGRPSAAARRPRPRSCRRRRAGGCWASSRTETLSVSAAKATRVGGVHRHGHVGEAEACCRGS